jgi:hypothetical protein
MKQKITVVIGKVSMSCVLCDTHIENYLKEVAQSGYSRLSLSSVSNKDSACDVCEQSIRKREK